MKDRVCKVLQEYDFIHTAILFGSFSNKTNNPLSDVDIAMGLTREITLLEFGQLVSVLEQEVQRRVDLVVLNNLYDRDTRLAYSIYQNHEEVFLNDKEFFDDFKFYTLKYFMDRKYLYDIFDKELAKRVKDGTFGKI